MQYVYTVRIEDKGGVSQMSKACTEPICRASVSARPYPKEVRITITHEGREIAYKAFGKTQIVWNPN